MIHPALRQASELIDSIERLGASVELTNVVTKASHLYKEVEALVCPEIVEQEYKSLWAILERGGPVPPEYVNDTDLVKAFKRNMAGKQQSDQELVKALLKQQELIGYAKDLYTVLILADKFVNWTQEERLKANWSPISDIEEALTMIKPDGINWL
jgi:hypothetical protein